MSAKKNARRDDALTARIIDATELHYEGEAPPYVERPSHVRAASGMAPMFENHYAVVQDDANFLALVDRDTHRVWSYPLPQGPGETRTYGQDESHLKMDLEACLTVPGTDDRLLLALGSGSGDSREWIVTVEWPEGADEPATDLMDPDRFYSSLRHTREFAGAGLNIEGAVFVDDDTIRLFQRGNAEPEDGHEAIDATGDVSWAALQAYMNDPDNAPIPELTNVVQYEIGKLDGIPLTFSDAEILDSGATLFSASAEADDETDYVAGSVLGIINGDDARWGPVTGQDGEPFGGKMEGLSVNPEDPTHVFFVIDSDDEEQPSEVFEVELDGPWFRQER
jgi:hypothetical protein